MGISRTCDEIQVFSCFYVVRRLSCLRQLRKQVPVLAHYLLFLVSILLCLCSSALCFKDNVPFVSVLFLFVEYLLFHTHRSQCYFYAY